ncbi:DUF559 domain-containing protein [Bifidobacterium sp. BRDM6]|uniref:DUF559 domain-containing protein n=2 Tax=Bifidobacterium choloepi TaxID=2614131 RepID=A0A6I5N1K9_9BIFI|nr:DUF559 domain-containing protein [Bifidobacterium choloepi]
MGRRRQYIPFNRDHIVLARRLRRDMTPHECKLWYHFLRNFPVRFNRQRPILDYIVDFFCERALLVVELDGGGHYTDDQRRHDDERTKRLGELGIVVLRIPNNEIDNNFEGVCSGIRRMVEMRCGRL